MANKQEIETQINAIENCLHCVKTDGCYTCREKQPDLNVVKDMLGELLENLKINK